MYSPRESQGKPYSKEELQAMLPKVGDRLMRVPHYYKLGFGDQGERNPPQPCVVEYVHVEHLWYRVRFESGRTESYKVPEAGRSRGGWGA